MQAGRQAPVSCDKSKSVMASYSVISDRPWTSAEDGRRAAPLDGVHAEVKDDYILLAHSAVIF